MYATKRHVPLALLTGAVSLLAATTAAAQFAEDVAAAPLLEAQLSQILPSDGATIPTNAQIFGVVTFGGLEVFATHCSDPAPSSIDCAGEGLPVEFLPCFGDSECLVQIDPGPLRPSAPLHIQVSSSTSPFQDLVFDVGPDDDTEASDAPILTLNDLSIPRQTTQSTVLSLTVEHTDDAPVGFAVYRTIENEAEVLLHIMPANGSAQIQSTALLLPQLGRPFCLRTAVIGIAGNESPASNEVCGDDTLPLFGVPGAFGCSQASPSFGFSALLGLLGLAGFRLRSRRKRSIAAA